MMMQGVWQPVSVLKVVQKQDRQLDQGQIIPFGYENSKHGFRKACDLLPRKTSSQVENFVRRPEPRVLNGHCQQLTAILPGSPPNCNKGRKSRHVSLWPSPPSPRSRRSREREKQKQGDNEIQYGNVWYQTSVVGMYLLWQICSISWTSDVQCSSQCR